MKLNIGMIGIGTIGTVHLRSLKQIQNDNFLSKDGVSVKIQGVADVDENKLNILRNFILILEYYYLLLFNNISII